MSASYASTVWLASRDSSVAESEALAQGLISYSPLPSQAEKDLAELYDFNCMTAADSAWVNNRDNCVFGARGSERKVVLFGDSHAAHWFGGVEAAAKNVGLELHLRLKTYCTPVLVARWDDRRGKMYDECEDWKAAVLEDLQEMKPDFIVWAARSSGSMSVAGPNGALSTEEAKPLWQKGLRDMMSQLQSTGAQVIAVADNPFAEYSIPGCVSNSPAQPELCDFALNGKVFTRYDSEVLEQIPGVKILDFIDVMCPEGTCKTVVNDAFVYRDQGHVTDTFARTMSAEFEKVLSS